MYKSNANNGRLFVMNLNPFINDIVIAFNVMMFIFSKELFFTSKINLGNIMESNEELPIPAGEMDLELEIDSFLHNLNDKELTKVILIGKIFHQVAQKKITYQHYQQGLKIKKH